MAARKWTEEQKLAHAEKIRENHKLRKEMYEANGYTKEGFQAWQDALTNNSRAKDWLTSFLHFLLEVKHAAKNRKYLRAFQIAHPEMNAVVINERLFFNLSVTALKKKHGTVAERIWKKMFVCHQQGGYSKKNGSSFDSQWYLNQPAFERYMIAELAHRKSGFSPAKALAVLRSFDELKRTPTEWEEQTNRHGYEDVVPVAESKRVTGVEERRALREKRGVIKVAVELRNKAEQHRRLSAQPFYERELVPA